MRDGYQYCNNCFSLTWVGDVPDDEIVLCDDCQAELDRDMGPTPDEYNIELARFLGQKPTRREGSGYTPAGAE